MTYQHPDHVEFETTILNTPKYHFRLDCNRGNLQFHQGSIFFSLPFTTLLAYMYIDDVFHWQYYK